MNDNFFFFFAIFRLGFVMWLDVSWDEALPVVCCVVVHYDECVCVACVYLTKCMGWMTGMGFGPVYICVDFHFFIIRYWQCPTDVWNRIAQYSCLRCYALWEAQDLSTQVLLCDATIHIVQGLLHAMASTCTSQLRNQLWWWHPGVTRA